MRDLSLHILDLMQLLQEAIETGERSARILVSSSFKDFFELDSNMYMIELQPEKAWIGRTLMELKLWKTRGLRVVAVREKGELWHIVAPDQPLDADSLLLVVMEKKDMEKWQ